MQNPNPHIAKDAFRPPSPGPGAYDPRDTITTSTIISPLFIRPKRKKKPKEPKAVTPGPGSYDPKVPSHVPTPRIMTNVEPTLPQALSPQPPHIPYSRRTTKPSACGLRRDSVPGPGKYNTKPVSHRRVSVPVFGSGNADANTPVDFIKHEREQKKLRVKHCDKNKTPGPTAYDQKPPDSHVTTPMFHKPTFDAEDAERRYKASRAAQDRRSRPWQTAPKSFKNK
eukprot:TRINITY_DN104630_c0_g1_i1.p1 TRINITY_DN104630_c0_g1~~TRINITY_DN104630_c0_g1_i1.p1  ORF type:complete len:225 (-),score=9.93 TRINITY_DN104630_c0_g1_i1:173-847(-)